MPKFQLHSVKLVYPPISNQEAEWLKKDKEVQEVLKRSNLYMLARRAEAKFEGFSCDESARTLRFRFTMPGVEGDDVAVRFVSAPNYEVPDDVEVEAEEKFIRCWEIRGGERHVLVDWFTTESLLYQRSRNHPAIEGLERYREFFSYELRYTGIATGGDSFLRLLQRAHEKRLEILSNEHPFASGARVTDELFLLFLEVEPLTVQILDFEDDWEDLAAAAHSDLTRIVADAEKAFTHVTKSPYNKIQFKHYPAGADGLHGTGLERYGYAICEDLTLRTPCVTLRGARRTDGSGLPGDSGDGIFVVGDEVVVFSGDAETRPPPSSAGSQED
jgi:hypothetical protein